MIFCYISPVEHPSRWSNSNYIRPAYQDCICLDTSFPQLKSRNESIPCAHCLLLSLYLPFSIFLSFFIFIPSPSRYLSLLILPSSHLLKAMFLLNIYVYLSMRSVRKVSNIQAGKKKQAYLECWKPNHPQSHLLGTPHISPSSAAIFGNIPRKLLSKWCLARLLLQS